MPTSLDELEVASAMGALDSDSAQRGAAAHAHVLRELQRTARRQTRVGDYLGQFWWRVDGSDDVEAPGGRSFVAPLAWVRVIHPWVAPRKRHLRTGSLRVRARIANGADVYLYVQTEAVGEPPPRISTARNILLCAGTGSWATYSTDAIELGRDDFDSISVWATADAVTTIDTGVYGTPDSGTAEGVSAREVYDADAAWIPAAFHASPYGVSIEFLNADGNVIVPRRTVSAGLNGATSLWFDEPITTQQATACNNAGVTYRLLASPAVRLGNVVLRENDGV